MKCDQLHRLLGSHNMSHPSNSLSLTLLLPGCQLLSPLHPLCNNLYLSLLAPGCHFLSPLPCLFHNNLLKRVLNHALFCFNISMLCGIPYKVHTVACTGTHYFVVKVRLSTVTELPVLLAFTSPLQQPLPLLVATRLAPSST